MLCKSDKPSIIIIIITRTPARTLALGPGREAYYIICYIVLHFYLESLLSNNNKFLGRPKSNTPDPWAVPLAPYNPGA